MQARLFDDSQQLILPKDLLEYTSSFIKPEESYLYLDKFIKEISWQQQKVMMYEKEIWTPRLCAWFGDDLIRAEDKRIPQLWTQELLQLKSKVEAYTGISFNGVLLNYYRDGKDSVAWHHDKDTIPGMKTEIASLSLGQERHFDFRNKENHKLHYSIKLENGSLLLMKGDLQKYWEHRIAKSTIPMKGRINLTFRKVLYNKETY